jgi:tRNA(Ile)-lysidine synthetase-like protein
MRLSGGTKSVKKILIDQKIPAHLRDLLPVLRDDAGLIAVCGIGANLDRITPVGVTVTLEKLR